MNTFLLLFIFKRTCTSFKKNPYTIKDFYKIEPNDEEAMMEALVSMGPVAVCFDCSYDTFYNYKSGIWDGFSSSGRKCTEKCKHAVVLIGIFSCIYFILWMD